MSSHTHQVEAESPDCAVEVATRVAGLIDKLQRGDSHLSGEQLHRLLVDEGWRQMAEARDLARVDWQCGDRPSLDDGEGVVREVRDWPDEVWDDPHALGWIHEQVAAEKRRSSFARHVHDEQKHASSTVSTQLYTPRWIADALCEEAFRVCGAAEPSVLDPAVGGGQMLLSALARLADRRPGATPQWLASKLWGFDLDGRAVDVARRTLALEIGRLTGERCECAENLLRRQIVEVDGLTTDRERRWDVVVTNPPYMGWRSMPAELRDRLDPRFRPYHGDLFAAFIARGHELSRGAVAILAQQSIWYLRRYEKARRDLLERGDLTLFIHLGARAFWNLDGEKASVVAFVQRCHDGVQKNGDPHSCGGEESTQIWDLRSLKSPGRKKKAFLTGDRRFHSYFDVETTQVLPGRPICHDLSRPLRRLFETNRSLSEVAEIPGGQNKTGRNKEFVRRWSDVPARQLRCVQELGARGSTDGRWVFYSKGGRFAPWWGNWSWVVDWSDEARRFYEENRTSNLVDERHWFREGITYTDFGGARFNARWMPAGCLFDMTGPAIFPREKWWPELDSRTRLGAALGIVNSSPARQILRALNPTLHFQVRNVRALPIPEIDGEQASDLAVDVWKLVEGVRRLHRHVAEDPLFEEQGEPAKVERQIERLRRLEEEIDTRICEYYGVERCPIDATSVADHHALTSYLGS